MHLSENIRSNRFQSSARNIKVAKVVTVTTTNEIIVSNNQKFNNNVIIVYLLA